MIPAVETLPSVRTPPAVGLGVELATIRVLALRDLKRFFRQRSRVLGALVQPLLFWAAIGSGFTSSFRLPGDSSVGYLQYFFPGVIVMVVLFTAIFTTLSLIEDRHEGFLQAVLVAPASRLSLVLGKTLGGVTIAMLQSLVFVALAPLAGFAWSQILWPQLVAILLLTAIGLSALGFALAWWIDSVQGYHAVMSVLLIPAWVVSGAMFPATGGSAVLRAIVHANPVAYSVAATRRALSGGAATAGLGTSALTEIVVVAGFAVGTLALAVWVSRFSRVTRLRRKKAVAK